ncbi:TolC family protein [Granulicella sp. WH15]|uniref:TolC family protein n=1 Tax=Granulicella sp. WH15 TaxID=2602070 RepID=UPI0013678041|nr:TolC family protein [Granulicella sp. WH15]QHN04751.1 TolC family protein [Granulicella sp. WH15]
MNKLCVSGIMICCAIGSCYQTSAQTPALSLNLPKSKNPFGPYMPSLVPAASLANSPRIDQLIHDGKLYLSLDDAILLALENNLDIAISRYNLPIAEADVERTRAGGAFRGVNAGIVQNTPGGGVGGLGAGAPGAGAGGTTGGAGGAGSGASGIVQSTLGAGTTVSSYDPTITGTASVEHYTQPLSNLQIYGVPSLQQNTTTANLAYAQAFPTGTALSFTLENNRQTGNSIYNYLNPALNVYYRIAFQQQLLAGFGLGPNLRYLRIAKNNRKISDIAFKDQVIATVTQIANMYWDLANAYQDVQVKERSFQFAKETLERDQKRLELRAIPAMDVTKAGAEMENREQELTSAKTTLVLQESLIKNALTKNLDDLALEEIPVVPTEKMEVKEAAADATLESLTNEALRDRPELQESSIDLDSRNISRAAARNALLPTVNLQAYYGGSGLAGVDNPASGYESSVPTDYSSSVRRAFDNSSPDYLVGVSVKIPLRNRVLKSDQYRSELEYRQSELLIQQQKKQIRIEVRNALYALQQSQARVASARRGRDLAQKTFDISKQEQQLGAGSNYQTLLAQRDLALAESSLTEAETLYEKSRIELERAVGSTLENHNIAIDDAKQGIVAKVH